MIKVVGACLSMGVPEAVQIGQASNHPQKRHIPRQAGQPKPLKYVVKPRKGKLHLGCLSASAINTFYAHIGGKCNTHTHGAAASRCTCVAF